MNYQYPFYQFNQMQQDERIWVPNAQAAEAYLMTPNSFVRLWDSNESVFYEKRTDASGRPSMEAYEYTRRAAPQATVAPSDAKTYEDRLDAIERRLIAIERGGHNAESEHDADVSAVPAV